MTILKLGQTLKSIIKAVNDNFAECTQYKVLWSGSRDIPSKSDGTSTTITLSDSLANYDGIMLQLEGCGAWTYFGDLTTGMCLGPVNQQVGCTVEMEGWNVFGYKCEVVSNTSLKFSDFIYTGSPLDLHEYLDIYTIRYLNTYSVYPLVKVIGIKLN